MSIITLICMCVFLSRFPPQAFIAQKFLESHAARGMILLDPFPPSPGEPLERVAHSTPGWLNKKCKKKCWVGGPCVWCSHVDSSCLY
jgi:hypothetical protein